MSPDGQCFVLGPALSKNLLTNRMLAKVPRAMTSSLPLRDPYELNSLGVNLLKNKDFDERESKYTLFISLACSLACMTDWNL